jgi:hypothetical protein
MECGKKRCGSVLLVDKQQYCQVLAWSSVTLSRSGDRALHQGDNYLRVIVVAVWADRRVCGLTRYRYRDGGHQVAGELPWQIVREGVANRSDPFFQCPHKAFHFLLMSSDAGVLHPASEVVDVRRDGLENGFRVRPDGAWGVAPGLQSGEYLREGFRYILPLRRGEFDREDPVRMVVNDGQVRDSS